MSDSQQLYTDTGLELKYPEIAYNMKPIFRPDPGIIPFYIPVLYPYLSGGKEKTDVVKQKNSSLLNKDKPNIGNINISNCIDIKVPRELCAYLDKVHSVSGGLAIAGDMSGNISVGNSGIPAVGPYNGNISIPKGSVSGTLTFAAKDNTIAKGSAWIVVFIGGDINKPVIISRYYE